MKRIVSVASEVSGEDRRRLKIDRQETLRYVSLKLYSVDKRKNPADADADDVVLAVSANVELTSDLVPVEEDAGVDGEDDEDEETEHLVVVVTLTGNSALQHQQDGSPTTLRFKRREDLESNEFRRNDLSRHYFAGFTLPLDNDMNPPLLDRVRKAFGTSSSGRRPKLWEVNAWKTARERRDSASKAEDRRKSNKPPGTKKQQEKKRNDDGGGEGAADDEDET